MKAVDMKIFKILKTLLLAFALLGASTSIFAYGGKGTKGKGGHKLAFKELNLSKEQLEKIKSLRKDMSGKWKPIKEEIKKIRTEIESAFVKNEPDSSLIKLQNKLASLRTQMMDMRFQKLILFKNILNEEQRKRFMKLKNKRKGRKGRFSDR